jgi:hypothetical protein
MTGAKIVYRCSFPGCSHTIENPHSEYWWRYLPMSTWPVTTGRPDGFYCPRHVLLVCREVKDEARQKKMMRVLSPVMRRIWAPRPDLPPHEITGSE